MTSPQTTHTKGPWFVVPPPWGDGTLIVEGSEDPHGRKVIAQVLTPNDGDDERPDAEIKANGRLIAAAPDLLAALRTAYHLDALFANHHRENCAGFYGDKPCNCGLDQARAAIAKAEYPLPSTLADLAGETGLGRAPATRGRALR